MTPTTAPKVEFVSIKTDTTKRYSPTESMVFTLTLRCNETIPDDLGFSVIFIGDVHCNHHDQKIGSYVIGPLEKGEVFFNIETSPIDLTKVPIKTLFGLTTILIVGKYGGNQFVRIGYIVNVEYPGLTEEQFLDSEEKVAIETMKEEGSETSSGSESEVSVMEDKELDEESNGDDEESDDEESNGEDEDINSDDEESDAESNSEEASGEEEGMDVADLISHAFGRPDRAEPTPLETPITAQSDDFEYKGYKMKKSLIEMTLMDKPIVNVFDIEWSNNEITEQPVESSSSESDSPKRSKLEE